MGNLGTLIPHVNAAFPGFSLSTLRLKLRMLLASRTLLTPLSDFVDPPPNSSLARLMQERPEMIGAVLWPYQNAQWSARERLQRIAAHYHEVDNLRPLFHLSIHEQVTLADFGNHHPNLHIVLDQPEWFVREGGFTINIFVGTFRAYSIAFSLFRDESETLCAYIGAIQGRNTPDSLDLYRTLTKALYGQRPRDFLLEALRALLTVMKVEKLFAVSEAARHHRHPYFKSVANAAGQIYDLIWEDRGGVKLDENNYVLPIIAPRRPIEDIKAKKRSLYRQRYAFLDQVSQDIESTVLSD